MELAFVGRKRKECTDRAKASHGRKAVVERGQDVGSLGLITGQRHAWNICKANEMHAKQRSYRFGTALTTACIRILGTQRWWNNGTNGRKETLQKGGKTVWCRCSGTARLQGCKHWMQEGVGSWESGERNCEATVKYPVWFPRKSRDGEGIG